MGEKKNQGIPSLVTGTSIEFESPISILVDFGTAGGDFHLSNVQRIQVTGTSPAGHMSFMCHQENGVVTIIPATYNILIFHTGKNED